MFISAPDSHSLGPNLSKVSLVTHSTLCSKVLKLQTSYNSTIGIELIWALDPNQNRAQSSPHSTVTLKFNFKQSDSPSLIGVFLQISHKTMAWILKQSCSPMIGLQLWCGHLTWILTILKATQPQSWAYNPDFRLSIGIKIKVLFANESKT